MIADVPIVTKPPQVAEADLDIAKQQSATIPKRHMVL